MEILWFIPTGSHDGRYLGTDIGSRIVTPDYLQQIAQAVDNLGYTGALLPTGRYPPLWFGGSSAAVKRVAAKHEEAYRTAELLFPRLPLQSEPASLTPPALSHVGEIGTNEKFAKQLTSAS